MIKLTDFKPSHLRGFTPKEDIPNLKEDMEFASDSEQFTVMSVIKTGKTGKSGKTVCFVGVKHLRPGVGELFIIAGHLVDVFKFDFFKLVYRLIYNFVIPKMGLHRLEMSISTAWEQGDKWARTLGFKFEGIARAWDINKQDHAIYAKVVV